MAAAVAVSCGAGLQASASVDVRVDTDRAPLVTEYDVVSVAVGVLLVTVAVVVMTGIVQGVAVSVTVCTSGQPAIRPLLSSRAASTSLPPAPNDLVVPARTMSVTAGARLCTPGADAGNEPIRNP